MIILKSKELAPGTRGLLIFFANLTGHHDSIRFTTTYSDPPNENFGILIVDTVQVLPPSLVVMSPVTPSPLATVLM